MTLIMIVKHTHEVSSAYNQMMSDFYVRVPTKLSIYIIWIWHGASAFEISSPIIMVWDKFIEFFLTVGPILFSLF